MRISGSVEFVPVILKTKIICTLEGQLSKNIDQIMEIVESAHHVSTVLIVFHLNKTRYKKKLGWEILMNLPYSLNLAAIVDYQLLSVANNFAGDKNSF